MIERLPDLMYPPVCPFCESVIRLSESGARGGCICSACRKTLPYVAEPRCKRCGKPVRRREQEYCCDCEKQEWHYESGRSLWLHTGPVKKSVYRFKYHNRRIYARAYAQEMVLRYGRTIKMWGIDRIVPVPLHGRRRRERGYNQAEVLAVEIGKLTGIPVDPHLVTRRKKTAPQKELGNRQRRANLHRAFCVQSGVEGEKILVIDDIYTTGSTVDEMARELSESGASKVYFLTISIGQGF